METLGSEWCVDGLWCLVPALKTDCPAVGHNLSNHCYWKQQVQQSETLSPSHRSLSETTSEQSADSASHPWLGDCQVNNQHQLRVVKTAWQITDFPLSAGDHHCCVGRGNTIYPHHRPTVCLHCCHLGEDTLATKLKLVTQKNTFFPSTHEPFPALSYRLPRLWILTVSYTRVSFFFFLLPKEICRWIFKTPNNFPHRLLLCDTFWSWPILSQWGFFFLPYTLSAFPLSFLIYISFGRTAAAKRRPEEAENPRCDHRNVLTLCDDWDCGDQTDNTSTAKVN